MKIALISPNYMAASETWIWRQIEYMKPWLTVIATFQTPQQNNYVGIPIKHLDKLPGLKERIKRKITKESYNRQINLQNNLLTLNKSTGFDTLYIHFLTTAYQLKDYLKRCDKRVLIHCHGYDVTWDLKQLAYPYLPAHPTDYVDFVLSIKDRVTFIANSQATARQLNKIGIGNQHIKTLLFGIKECSLSKAQATNEKTPLSILFLGRLVDCKGPHKTIFAFEAASSKGLNAELTIAGDGPLLTTVRLLANNSPYKERIKVLGPVSYEQGNILRSKASIFTTHNMTGELTGQEEAYGVAFLEAMAAGLPIVTGKSGGLTETIIDGETGLFFEPGNIDQHAALLLDLANNPEKRSRLGRNGIKHIQKNFNFQIEQAKFNDILKA